MVEVVCQFCLCEGSFLVWCKVVFLVGGLFGYMVEGVAFYEKFEGFDVQCEVCGMILKVLCEILLGIFGV